MTTLKMTAALLLALALGLTAAAAMAEGDAGSGGVLYANAQGETVTCTAPDGTPYTLRPGESLVRWPSGDFVVVPNQFAYGYVTSKNRWNSITNPYSKDLEDFFRGVRGNNLCFGTAASIAYSIQTGGSFEDFWEGVMSISSDVHPTTLMNKKRDKLYADSPIAAFLRQSGFSVDSASLKASVGKINQNIENGTSYIVTRKGGHAGTVVRVYIEDGQTKLAYADAQLKSSQPVPATIRTDTINNFNKTVVVITPDSQTDGIEKEVYAKNTGAVHMLPHRALLFPHIPSPMAPIAA